MLRTVLAFLGLSVGIYWLVTMPSPQEQPASLNLVPTLLPALSTRDLGLKSWLEKQARTLLKNGTQEKSVIEIKKKALSLTPADVESLKRLTLSNSATSEERVLAVYTIGLAESADAHTALKQISLEKVPVSASDVDYPIEVTVRLHAMNDLISNLPSTELKPYLQEITALKSSPELTKRALEALSRTN